MLELGMYRKKDFMKRFDYKYATVDEIAEYFEVCSRACISSVRRNHRDNAEMHDKLEKAYAIFKGKQNRKMIEQM